MQNLILKQSRRIKQLIQMFFDGSVLYLAYLFSYFHDSGSISVATQHVNLVLPLIAIPICICVFYGFGLYRSLIRYILADSLSKTIALFFTAAVIFWSLSAAIATNFGWTHFVTFILVSLALGLGGRFFARSFLLLNNGANKPSVIVYGAKGRSSELLSAIKQRQDFIPVAVIDDDPELTGALIGGVRVYLPQDLQKLILNKGVSTVLVSMSEVSRASQKQLSNLLKTIDVQIKQIPAISDIISGRANIMHFKPVKIEDLLGREPIPPILELMNANTTGKSIMVTGAGGSIGSEICRQLIATNPARLVLLDNSEYGL